MKLFKQTQNRKLQSIILIIVVSIAISVSNTLVNVTKVSTVKTILDDPFIQLIIAISVALFGYHTIINIVFFAVNRSEFCLHMYYGKLFLRGYWYYEYVKLTEEGENASKPKYGVWQIDQDFDGIHISGYGLYDNLNKYRTTVESKTQLIENEHCFEVILSKIEAINPGVKYFAKASITIDNSRRYKKTTHFHSYTYTFGGSQAGEIHIDTYYKVPNAKTEDDVIKYLKDNRVKAETQENENKENNTPSIISEKQCTECKSIIKLDNNFDIHIHPFDLIKNGVEDNGRKYYKIYYEKGS